MMNTQKPYFFSWLFLLGSLPAFIKAECPNSDFLNNLPLWTQRSAWVCVPFETTNVLDLVSYTNNGCECFIPKPELTSVDEGWFVMGCGTGMDATFDPECLAPSSLRNSVFLPEYQIGRHEITFDQYGAFLVYGGPFSQGRSTPDDAGFGRGNRPVIHLNQYDMMAYCNWLSDLEGFTPVYQYLGSIFIPPIDDSACTTDCHDLFPITIDWDADGYRLPTEAEWLKAARGDCTDNGVLCDERNFPWGGDCTSANPGCDPECPFESARRDGVFRANYWPGSLWEDPNAAVRHCSDTSAFPDGGDAAADGFAGTAPVGSFPYPSPFGCYDLAGNVGEMVQGWFWDGYGNVPEMCDPKGPLAIQNQPHFGTVLGGDWQSGAWRLLLYQKLAQPITTKNALTGFRVVRRPTFLSDQCPETFQAPSMQTIPDGEFIMGCRFWTTSGAGDVGQEVTSCRSSRSMFRHRVFLTEYEIGTFELTFNDYDAFIASGSPLTAGRTYPSPATVDRDDYPVTSINKYDMYAYCNWLSQRMGYAPVYTYEGSNVIPIVGNCGSTCHDDYPVEINWDANGYRLPTEAEWQKAARGAEPCDDITTCVQQVYPWGDECPNAEIEGEVVFRANYFPAVCDPLNAITNCYWHAERHCSAIIVDDQIPPPGDCVCGTDTQALDGFEDVAPVGSFPFPSPFGCYDMAGNVAEVPQDFYLDNVNFYGNSLNDLCDPTGLPATPGATLDGALLGGDFRWAAFRMVVFEKASSSQNASGTNVGFRIVRRVKPSLCGRKIEEGP